MEHSEDTRPVLLKTVPAIENKEKLRNCHKPRRLRRHDDDRNVASWIDPSEQGKAKVHYSEARIIVSGRIDAKIGTNGKWGRKMLLIVPRSWKHRYPYPFGFFTGKTRMLQQGLGSAGSGKTFGYKAFSYSFEPFLCFCFQGILRIFG